MKFNTKLTFEASNQHSHDNDNNNNAEHNNNINCSSAGQQSQNTERKCGGRVDDQIKRQYIKLQPPLGHNSNQDNLSIISGQAGIFHTIKNDFSIDYGDDDGDSDDELYRDEANWSAEKKEKVKRVRFAICTLALIGLAFALMSRLILNVSIVEMVKKKPIDVIIVDSAESYTTQLIDNMSSLDESTTTLSPLVEGETTTLASFQDSAHNATTQDTDETTTGNETHAPVDTLDYYEDGLHFNWTKRDVSLVLGSFYVGYMPGILVAGGIAQRYGAKYPLFVCVFATSLINILTPTIAQISLGLLIASRICLGLLQGSLIPALYELFNRWLTSTESSIFAPMLKVSIPMGSVIGTLMPGLLASLGLDWPYLFYFAGSTCFIWSVAWFYFATSYPQTNRYVEENELKRIMRKKVKQQVPTIAIEDVIITSKENPTEKSNYNNHSSRAKNDVVQPSKRQQQSSSTPWLLIVSNPSVLALTLVKYTYNLGIDFVYLELAVYLREAHDATIETISAIASSGYCMQMLLITLIGWVAKTVVANRTFGLSVTKWRKVFQSGSNFTMAWVYLILALTDPSIELASALLIGACFFWMLGAGGESMVPYDLSSKYPASIVGLTHSVSILSGVTVPALFDLVIGEETKDPERWRLLFTIIAGALAFGGLVFSLVLKSKPFLPEEMVPVRRQSTNSRKTSHHNKGGSGGGGGGNINININKSLSTSMMSNNKY